MFYIRPVRKTDIDALEALARAAGLGITNLPKKRELLEWEIHASITNFHLGTKEKTDEIYLFVLEEIESKRLVGCSGIIAKAGLTYPLIFYRIDEGYLKAVYDTSSPSEICSLYLAKDFRKGGIGYLLSFSRFLFIADFKERFEETITAEMRGFADEAARSPFWDAISSHFGGKDFSLVLNQLQDGSCQAKDFIIDEPILIDSLPLSAKKVIGRTHPNTTAALKILEKQHFAFTKEVDLIDAGPRLKANTPSILLIQQSKIAEVVAVEDSLDSPVALVSNQSLDFRACLAPLKIHPSGEVSLSKKVCDVLLIDKGASIRYAFY